MRYLLQAQDGPPAEQRSWLRSQENSTRPHVGLEVDDEEEPEESGAGDKLQVRCSG